jgi:GNAT superfamily N-acetyltransferase
MEAMIRPGRPEDRDQIAAWTRDTFTWGDYVAGAFDDWISDPAGSVFVAEVDGRVVGMARVAMLSPDEAWSQGARVHPDFRQAGVGLAIGRHVRAWAEEREARVIRLTVENWNRAARRHVEKQGFRAAGKWVMAERGVGENSPVPEGNGGRRIPAPDGLRPAVPYEAQPALLSWSGSPLERASRGLIPIGWTWRRLRPDDLAEAARNKALWEGRPGWAIAAVSEDTFEVSWVSTVEEDAAAMVRALIDRAADAGVERIEAILPDVPWLRRAVQRSGCELHPLTVFSLAL